MYICLLTFFYWLFFFQKFIKLSWIGRYWYVTTAVVCLISRAIIETSISIYNFYLYITSINLQIYIFTNKILTKKCLWQQFHHMASYGCIFVLRVPPVFLRCVPCQGFRPPVSRVMNTRRKLYEWYNVNNRNTRDYWNIAGTLLEPLMEIGYRKNTFSYKSY